jgi:hypothetical protein
MFSLHVREAVTGAWWFHKDLAGDEVDARVEVRRVAYGSDPERVEAVRAVDAQGKEVFRFDTDDCEYGSAMRFRSR